MTIKIGICGKMCSGKSTLANKIKNKLENKDKNKKIVIDSFASKIYEIARELFNMKENDRNLLQQIGTKMREIDGDVWINHIINKYNDENIIIDDVRYINEAISLKKNGYSLIKLNISKELQLKRLKNLYPNPELHINKMNHDSETESDNINKELFDIIIDVDNNINFINKIINKIII